MKSKNFLGYIEVGSLFVLLCLQNKWEFFLRVIIMTFLVAIAGMWYD